ncbi:MAG: hypothetical protein AAGD07_17700 [Planctomycetota bacterium]
MNPDDPLQPADLSPEPRFDDADFESVTNADSHADGDPVELGDEPVEVDIEDPGTTSVSAVEPDETVALRSDAFEMAYAHVQQPFVGRWNTLISTTNWEKGRIISQWRQALIDAEAHATLFSDEAWASRVGGVTAPHVGRLRRVFDRFGAEYESYSNLYWSHFLAALDWDDAALWLQGAVEEKWSVSQMRHQRWEATGAVAADRPDASHIVSVEVDEDAPASEAQPDFGTAPAQGGGASREFDEEGAPGGPVYEDPDFGEHRDLDGSDAPTSAAVGNDVPGPTPGQPFAGLPTLPDDLADVFEQMKLAILREKAQNFESTDAQTLRGYLQAMLLLIES